MASQPAMKMYLPRFQRPDPSPPLGWTSGSLISISPSNLPDLQRHLFSGMMEPPVDFLPIHQPPASFTFLLPQFRFCNLLSHPSRQPRKLPSFPFVFPANPSRKPSALEEGGHLLSLYLQVSSSNSAGEPPKEGGFTATKFKWAPALPSTCILFLPSAQSPPFLNLQHTCLGPHLFQWGGLADLLPATALPYLLVQDAWEPLRLGFAFSPHHHPRHLISNHTSIPS